MCLLVLLVHLMLTAVINRDVSMRLENLLMLLMFILNCSELLSWSIISCYVISTRGLNAACHSMVCRWQHCADISWQSQLNLFQLFSLSGSVRLES